MPSKESIAVILGAIALGLRNKGSKDVQPVIENITEEELTSRFARYPTELKKNQFLHGSTGFENIANPVLKRNPKHPIIFSQEQELETPDHGIYISQYVDTVLWYTKGKENRYVSLIEVNPDDLMIDEDTIGEVAYSVNNVFGEQHKLAYEMIMPKLYDNPKSPINIILKLYKQAMKFYGHHKPKDMKYPLQSIERLDEIDEIDKVNYYVEDRSLPKLVIFLGKRINFIMSEEERKILVKALMRGLLSSSEDDEYVDTIYRPSHINFFIPDRENKGIKPIKVFRIID